MCCRQRKRSGEIEKNSIKGFLREGMSPDGARVTLTGPLSNKNRRDMIHHLPVHLQPNSKGHKGEYYFLNTRFKVYYLQVSVGQMGSKPPGCSKCCRIHSGSFPQGYTSIFKCGQIWNLI